MDVIPLLTSIAGALGVGGLLANAINSRRQRRDKREEREAARDESHRDQLRHAYAEFIAVYRYHLEAGRSVIDAAHRLRHAHKRRRTASQHASFGDDQKADYDRAQSAEDEKSAAYIIAVDDFRAARSNADTKAMNVALLEDDQERRGLILALVANRLRLPTEGTDEATEGFLAGLRERQKQLDAFVQTLGGLFGPSRWHARKSGGDDTLGQISTGTKPQLPAGEEPNKSK